MQRYPVEWAAALRADDRRTSPSCSLPAHGLPIAGAERIATVLDDIATALEDLVADVLAMMNDGATLDTIIHTVSVPADTSGASPTSARSTTSPSSSCATSGGSSAAGGTAPRHG